MLPQSTPIAALNVSGAAFSGGAACSVKVSPTTMDFVPTITPSATPG